MARILESGRRGSMAIAAERKATDFAQAISLALVILYHINDITIGWGESHWRLWYIYNAAEPVLMPLFFAFAGHSAGRKQRAPSEKAIRDRLAGYICLYLLWTCIYIFYGIGLSAFHISQLARCSDNPFLCITLPINPLWFVHHLIICLGCSYFFPKKGSYLIFIFLILQAASYFLLDWYASRMIMAILFFSVGYYYLDRITDWSFRIDYAKSFSMLLLYIIMVLVDLKIAKLTFPLAHDFQSLVGISLTLRFSLALTRRYDLGPFIAIGKNMLPIYLLHWIIMFPLLLIYHLLYQYSAPSGHERMLVQAICPFILTYLTAHGALVVYARTKSIRGLYIPHKSAVRGMSNILLATRGRCHHWSARLAHSRTGNSPGT